MEASQIQGILDKQRKYYRTGATLPVSFRVEMLKKLRSTIQKYEAEIAEAISIWKCTDHESMELPISFDY